MGENNTQLGELRAEVGGTSRMTRIPNIFHFVFLTRPMAGVTPFSFGMQHYVAIMSCLRTQKPDKIMVHTDAGEPSGEWWDRCKQHVQLNVGLDYSRAAASCPPTQLYQVADAMRSVILSTYGGVYSDLDAVFLRPVLLCVDVYSDSLFLGREAAFFPAVDGRGRFLSSLMACKAQNKALEALLTQHWNIPDWVPDRSMWLASYIYQHINNTQGGIKAVQWEHVWWWPNGQQTPFTHIPGGARKALRDAENAGSVVSLVNRMMRGVIEQHTAENIWQAQNLYSQVCRRYVRPPQRLTPLVTARIDSHDRLETLLVNIEYMYDVLGLDNVIVVEIDHEPTLAGLMRKYSHVRYVFLQIVGESFDRTTAVNAAQHLVKTPLLATWDCDVFLSRDQLLSTENALMSRELDIVVPFNRFLHVKRHFLEYARQGNIRLQEADKAENILYRIDKVIGHGVVFYRSDVFMHMRGMSELCHGFGCDDDEIIFRAQKLGFRYGQMNAPGVHIAHERTPTSQPTVYYEYNRAERDAVMAMSPDEVAAYYGITRTVGEYCRKIPLSRTADQTGVEVPR